MARSFAAMVASMTLILRRQPYQYVVRPRELCLQKRGRKGHIVTLLRDPGCSRQGIRCRIEGARSQKPGSYGHNIGVMVPFGIAP